jgi:AcrR family transcriptional regulator
MNTLKQAKYNLVISNTKPLMLKKGINNLKISDIAREIKIGEATIYRYFGNKTSLVIEVGVSLWNDIFMELSSLAKQLNGYECVKGFFNFFLEGYESSKEVFVFLDEFDSLMVKDKVTKESLTTYDEALYDVKTIFHESYNKGLEDGSIIDTLNQDEFYYTTTHMILGICKRLASNGAILSSDELVKDIVQIKLALDICLQYIKK